MIWSQLGLLCSQVLFFFWDVLECFDILWDAVTLAGCRFYFHALMSYFCFSFYFGWWSQLTSLFGSWNHQPTEQSRRLMEDCSPSLLVTPKLCGVEPATPVPKEASAWKIRYVPSIAHGYSLCMLMSDNDIDIFERAEHAGRLSCAGSISLLSCFGIWWNKGNKFQSWDAFPLYHQRYQSMTW